LVWLLDMPAAVHDLGAADQDAWIDAERPAEQAENDDGSDPDAAAADRDAHTAAAEATFVAARVLDIVAAAKIIPTHDRFLPKIVAIIAELRALVQLRRNWANCLPLSQY